MRNTVYGNLIPVNWKFRNRLTEYRVGRKLLTSYGNQEMSTAVVPSMGKARGRPPKPEEDKKLVKLNADLVEMITWIVRIKKRDTPGYTAADLVEPLLKPQIVARYKLIEDDVKRIKKAEESAASKSSEEEE